MGSLLRIGGMPHHVAHLAAQLYTTKKNRQLIHPPPCLSWPPSLQADPAVGGLPLAQRQAALPRRLQLPGTHPFSPLIDSRVPCHLGVSPRSTPLRPAHL